MQQILQWTPRLEKQNKKIKKIDQVFPMAITMYETKKHNRKVRAKKKEYRCTPTFVNLKSNTMKNTMQKYGLRAFYPK